MSGDLFSVPATVEILDFGAPVQGPASMVYSTAPRVCIGADGATYFTKGDASDAGVVAAEAVGYTFARALDLMVPEFAVTTSGAASLFASKNVEGCLRDVAPFLPKHLPTVAKAIVLDVFLFNDDRNMGGFVMHPKLGLVAIDFEKSKTVRLQYPLVQIAQLPPKSVWPRDELGRVARGTPVPAEFVRRIERLTDAQIRSATLGVAQVVGGYTWPDASELALKKRRDKLSELVREAWQ